MNINLIYDWIVNADQYEEKFGAELAAGKSSGCIYGKIPMILKISQARAALRI